MRLLRSLLFHNRLLADRTRFLHRNDWRRRIRLFLVLFTPDVTIHVDQTERAGVALVGPFHGATGEQQHSGDDRNVFHNGPK
jgi:hypothetical protein